MDSCCVYLFLDMQTGGTKFGISVCPRSRLSQLRCRDGYPGLVWFCAVEIMSLHARQAAKMLESSLRENHDNNAPGIMGGKLDFTDDRPADVMGSLMSLVAIMPVIFPWAIWGWVK